MIITTERRIYASSRKNVQEIATYAVIKARFDTGAAYQDTKTFQGYRFSKICFSMSSSFTSGLKKHMCNRC